MKITHAQTDSDTVSIATMRRWQYLAWTYFILAALSLLLTWHYPLINEEGNYTTLVVDMMQHHRWLQPFLSGYPYPRPPLMSWLALPWVWLFGYHSTLTVLRVLTVIYTTATAGILVWFVKKEYVQAHPLLPILSGCLFLSGDVLFKRGWLAYADPLAALCVFASMLLLYRALRCEKLLYLAWSLPLVFLGYLAKEPTAYTYYVLTGLSLLCAGIGVRFAFRWQTLCLGVLGLLLPYFAWHALTASAGSLQLSTFLSQVHFSWRWSDIFPPLAKFLVHELLRYNILLLLIIAAAFFMRQPVFNKRQQRTLIYIIVFNLAPYLLFVAGGIAPRYLLPLMPWLAIFGAQIILRCSKRFTLWLLIILWGGLCVKYVLGFKQLLFVRNHIARISQLDSTPTAIKIMHIAGDKDHICVRGGEWTTILQLYANLNMLLPAAGRNMLENHVMPFPRHCDYLLTQQELPASYVVQPAAQQAVATTHAIAKTEGAGKSAGALSKASQWQLIARYKWGIRNRHSPFVVFLYRQLL